MPWLRAIFAGGGTGGHLFPGIAIADAIKQIVPGAEILFIGSKGRIEARIVPQRGYKFRSLWISGLRRGFRISNFLFPLKVVVSTMQALAIMREFKPDVVVGTGGYVSGPPLYAATLMRIPTLIHEGNSYPGITTRLLAKRVDEVHLTFDRTKNYLPTTQNVLITGNPTRDDLEGASLVDAYSYFGFRKSEEKKTVLIFGGSLGARSINEAVGKHIDQLLKSNLRVIWQTGEDYFESAKAVCANYPRDMVWVSPFIDRMDYAYAASDIVVCRAGAVTIAELTRLGKSAILIPYPHAAENHQVGNAKSLTEQGAAELLYDDQVGEKLPSVLLKMLDGSTLKKMSEQSKKLGRPDAARAIAERVMHLAKRRKPSEGAESSKG